RNNDTKLLFFTFIMMIYITYRNLKSKHYVQKPIQRQTLRLIVLTLNRADSLKKCLNSINEANYIGFQVILDIWIDRSTEMEVDQDTLETAQKFNFIHGEKIVHVHKEHVGLYGQWINTWTPDPAMREIGLILEDDVDLSVHFLHWLKQANAIYGRDPRISGISLSTIYPDMLAASARYLAVQSEFNHYLYKISGTWGFSPNPHHWSKFQKWFHEIRKNATFKPYVENLHQTDAYQRLEEKGKEGSMWSMWWIYYMHTHGLHCVFPNLPDGQVFAQHRQERGLHYNRQRDTWEDHLVKQWNISYIDFFGPVPKYDYKGRMSIYRY
ncbi:unnamed protein product, partial [Owenia fusiformis]